MAKEIEMPINLDRIEANPRVPR